MSMGLNDFVREMERARNEIDKMFAEKEKSKPAHHELLGKTVRYKQDIKNRGPLKVVAIYDQAYKSYETSTDNIRVQNAKGTHWTCNSSEVVEVVEVKSYAFTRANGAIVHFNSEEAGYKEAKQRELELHRGMHLNNPIRHRDIRAIQLTRAPQYDVVYEEKVE